jgi:AcrR family transcriptional regulator
MNARSVPSPAEVFPDFLRDDTPTTARDETRCRLLRAAVDVFAHHGYHGASTREICELAGANTAAIHYHFRDKAGLYRELFRLPIEWMADASRPMTDPQLPLLERLAHFYRGMLSVLSQDSRLRQLALLHAREEVEPSGVLGDCHTQAIRIHHDRMLHLLLPEFGLQAADEALHGLAFAVGGVALVYFMARPAVEAFAPGLTATPESRELLVQRCAIYGQALIHAERERRKTA